MFSDAMTEKVEHDCYICHEKVLQTSLKLAPHVQRHNMSIENYFKKFILGQAVDNTEEKFLAWVNQCRYECKICNESCLDVTVFISHLINVHDTNAEDYKQKYGPLLSVKVQLKLVISKLRILEIVPLFQ